MNNNLKLNKNGSVTLCARRKCCPELSVDSNDSNYVIIKDDYGNSIRVLRSQAELITDGVRVVYGEDSDNKSNRQLLHD